MEIAVRVSDPNNPDAFKIDVELHNIGFEEIAEITDDTIKSCVCSALEQIYKIRCQKDSSPKPIDLARAICYGTPLPQSTFPEAKSDGLDSDDSGEPPRTKGDN